MCRKIISIAAAAIFICCNAYAMCGMCGSDEKGHTQGEEAHEFSSIAEEAKMKDGVKKISYEQFMEIRNSQDKYKLLDVLTADSYYKGHIEGAISLPENQINKASAEKILSKDDNIIVYCASFQCPASTTAAKKLSALGYNVLDYKGGLKEWQKKGNTLTSSKSFHKS